ncbi:MAG: ATP-binding protein [Pseudomonadota bacterium]
MDPLELTETTKPLADSVEPEEQVEATGVATQVDYMQLAFWALMLIAVAAACIALAWPEAGGATWPVTMIAMGAFGLVAILWLLRGAGRRLGLFPEKGLAEASISVSPPKFGWIDALDEAILITERGGAAVASNNAYRELAALTVSGLGDVTRAPTVDRLFGANPGLAGPIFRLSKSAKAGDKRREVLPAITIGAEGLPVQFEIGVSPLPRNRVLWRLRRIAGTEEATGAADMKALYVEDAPMGFFASRPDGTVTYANAWLRELIGLPESTSNVRIDDIMRPEFVKLLRRERKSGAPGRADIRIRARDGVEVPVQTLTTWTGRGADAAGRTIVISNAKGLLGSEDRLTAMSASRPPRPDGDPMFDDAPFGVVRLEGTSLEAAVIIDANRSLMAITEGKAAPGTKFSDLFVANEGQEKLEELLLESLNKPVELSLAGDDPKTANVVVVLDNEGMPSVAYVIDRTEQKQLEMSLAQGQKMQAIGKLAGGVAHDFNNVLSGIILTTEKLTIRHPLGDPSYSELKIIQDLSHRAAELVKMLLAYARKQTFKREVLNITDTLSEFYILLRQLVDERIELDINHGRDLPLIKADKNQLETAIINLSTNARDAMLSDGMGGGKLTIRTHSVDEVHAHKNGFDFVDPGQYLLIEVKDTGKGIPEADQAEIFKPFFTTKEAGLGTGLGLATVYGIVKQSGGFICLRSEVGEGTTFEIYLPALSAAAVAEYETEAKAAAETFGGPRLIDMAGRGRILFVEDEESLRGIAAQLLRTRGYEVEEAADGEEALAIMQAQPESFDLVISDVVMPGITGPALIKQAKDLLGDARVIFISGYAERDLAEAIEEDREISFLPKPFTVSQLAERVKQELGARQNGRNEAA